MKIIGILLILAGIAALAYGGLTYTTHKRAVDMGPLQIERRTRHTIPLPPLVGVGGILLGAALLFTSRSK